MPCGDLQKVFRNPVPFCPAVAEVGVSGSLAIRCCFLIELEVGTGIGNVFAQARKAWAEFSPNLLPCSTKVSSPASLPSHFTFAPLLLATISWQGISGSWVKHGCSIFFPKPPISLHLSHCAVLIYQLKLVVLNPECVRAACEKQASQAHCRDCDSADPGWTLDLVCDEHYMNLEQNHPHCILQGLKRKPPWAWITPSLNTFFF